MGVIVHKCFVDNPKRCNRIGVTAWDCLGLMSSNYYAVCSWVWA